MLWNTIRKQLSLKSLPPQLSRRHATAVIGGRAYEIELKFKPDGEPYFVERTPGKETDNA